MFKDKKLRARKQDIFYTLYHLPHDQETRQTQEVMHILKPGGVDIHLAICVAICN